MVVMRKGGGNGRGTVFNAKRQRTHMNRKLYESLVGTGHSQSRPSREEAIIEDRQVIENLHSGAVLKGSGLESHIIRFISRTMTRKNEVKDEMDGL